MVKAIQDLHFDMNTLLTYGTTTATSSLAGLFAPDTDTIWSRLVTLARGFVDGVLHLASAEILYVKSDSIKTEELCVGAVCVDEETFLNMVEQSNSSPIISDSPQTNIDLEPVVEVPVVVPEIIATSTSPATTTDPVVEPAPIVEDPVAEPVVDPEIVAPVIEEVIVEPIVEPEPVI